MKPPRQAGPDGRAPTQPDKRFPADKIPLHLAVAGFVAGFTAMVCAGAETTVTVDCAQVVGPHRRPERYVNNSLRAAPPPALANLVECEFGRPAIVRCWLCLDDMWDYRDGSYHFNYPIGKDTYRGDTVKFKYDRDRVTETDVRYEDYLTSFSQHSDEVLLNVRRYEREVVNGVISLAKWKEVLKTGLKHYKERCPNLRYLEVLNESRMVQFGGLTDDQYYDFYRAGYQVVNELNAELKPALPLRVGGPSTVNKTGGVRPFLDRYAADPNPAKRLDFVSFHEYEIGSRPQAAAGYEEEVDGWLTARGLPDDVRIFITEIGVGHPAPEPKANLTQAAGVISFQYHVRQSKDLVLFPWVLFHNPVQLSLVQFDRALRLTPFGAATKMLTLHRGNDVQGSMAGQGQVRAWASLDETGLAVQVWNYNGPATTVSVAVKNLPEGFRAKPLRLRQFLIDGQHSNCFAKDGHTPGLETIAEKQVAAADVQSLSVALKPNALCLWLIETRSP